jgi:NAD(P)-dependent dehydrogenase (short-subunit alcohol dehydrogenase family)
VAAAWELGRYGITANVLCPPATDTGWMTVEVTTLPAKAGSFCPLQRRLLQQELLRLRLTQPPTLTPEGSIQARAPDCIPELCCSLYAGGRVAR